MAYLLCGVLFVAISFGIVVLDDLTGTPGFENLVRLESRVMRDESTLHPA